MKNFILFIFVVYAFQASAAMTPESCESKIKAAVLAGTGQAVRDPNLIKYFCQGIIEEIQQNAQVQVEGVQSGSSTKTGSVQ